MQSYLEHKKGPGVMPKGGVAKVKRLRSQKKKSKKS